MKCAPGAGRGRERGDLARHGRDIADTSRQLSAENESRRGLVGSESMKGFSFSNVRYHFNRWSFVCRNYLWL